MLCTLRRGRHLPRRNTRYRAGATPYPDRTFTGWNTPAFLAHQWLAYVLPYRRFADTLASASARLRAGADRYSFTVVDFHLLLFAGLPGAPKVLDFRNGRTRSAFSISLRKLGFGGFG